MPSFNFHSCFEWPKKLRILQVSRSHFLFSSKGMEIIFLKSSKSPGCFSRSKPWPHIQPRRPLIWKSKDHEEMEDFAFVWGAVAWLTRNDLWLQCEKCCSSCSRRIVTWVLRHRKMPAVWINSPFPASVQSGRFRHAAWKVPLYTNISYQLWIYIYI